MNHFPKSAVAAALALGLTAVQGVDAREPGAPDNVLAGAGVDIPEGFLPPPGITAVGYFTNYSAATVNADGVFNGQKIDIAAYTTQLWWRPAEKVLGADFGAFLLQPIAEATVNNSNTKIAESGTQSKTGLANLTVQPVNLAWTITPAVHFSIGEGFIAPTGEYQTPFSFLQSPKHPIDDYIGNNFWTFQSTAALTAWDRGPNGYLLSLQALYNKNTENEATQYLSGDQIFLNFTATKSIEGYAVGVVGYYTAQITNDKDYGHYYAPFGQIVGPPGHQIQLPFVDVTSKPERFALGPTINGPLGAKAYWDLSWLHDFKAVSDTKGDLVVLTIRVRDVLDQYSSLPLK